MVLSVGISGWWTQLHCQNYLDRFSSAAVADIKFVKVIIRCRVELKPQALYGNQKSFFVNTSFWSVEFNASIACICLTSTHECQDLFFRNSTTLRHCFLAQFHFKITLIIFKTIHVLQNLKLYPNICSMMLLIPLVHGINPPQQTPVYTARYRSTVFSMVGHIFFICVNLEVSCRAESGSLQLPTNMYRQCKDTT